MSQNHDDNSFPYKEMEYNVHFRKYIEQLTIPKFEIHLTNINRNFALNKIQEYEIPIPSDRPPHFSLFTLHFSLPPYLSIHRNRQADLLNAGQKTYAIGGPMGFENTITDGIVSGLDNCRIKSNCIFAADKN